MDREYWDAVYSKTEGDKEPSLFARDCIEANVIRPHQNLLEIGHGNGRDALWFAEFGVEVFGCDQSGIVESSKTIHLQQGDFAELDLEQIQSRFGQDSFDHVYSRFSWHSITELDECKTLDWIKQVLHPYGSLLIECRTVYDELFEMGSRKGTWTRGYADGHCRRFIKPGRLINYLLEDGFQINYAELRRGFAPHKDEDPKILRVHAIFTGES